MSDDAGVGGPESESAETAAEQRKARLRQVLEQVRQQLATLRFGQIVITVQDGVVVQIDRTEKTRLR